MMARQQDDIIALSKTLIEEGRLVEAGFRSFQAIAFPNADPQHVLDLKCAFFASAQHLFGTILSILDPGQEPTDTDMLRISQIAEELDGFGRDFIATHIPREASA
jgi:hypothetical protein